MHNCKLTRSSLIELALDELQPAQKEQLLAELQDCAACHEEYTTLRNTLRVSGQALRSALPAESFWSGYHARLSEQIEKSSDQHSSSVQPAQLSGASRLWDGLWQIATTSVRIPFPVAAALILLIGISTFFAVRSRGQVNALALAQSRVETRTVEVPVIQEKVVTRVVYVEKNRRRPQSDGRQLARAKTPRGANRVARAGANTDGTTAISLAGFKPTDQVKLKIIKGSYRDEK